MEAYWIQYREHCLAQVARSVASLESLRRQQLALVEFDGNPLWIAALGREIAEAREAMDTYRAVLARLDADGRPTG